MTTDDLSPNMRDALAEVRAADPHPFKTASPALIRGCEALERRGLVRLAGERKAFEAPEWVLTDAARMPPPTGDWHMVSCATCGLLVGWTRQPMTKPFYCIPHFDGVAHLPDDDPSEFAARHRRKAGS